ncbi:hypothetical protein HCCG_01773 [Helicobacter cinaedi CCUG 18818 = ATCC BAA-847]|uniref:Uncharacterized protein n=1 Tax=Helicobacter cinaedi CCUG 18818 = ATCC BAA-847 TaxID=537971 RepID=A0ABN0BDV5_9HELI|nr:hypothetical protein HCCG_01773 [Helicobacter cinaedi CCUG 18818 = ATCC BAA-847]BBB19241.1 hypothetical protein HC081234_04180 [Helicobacter cinaedi]
MAILPSTIFDTTATNIYTGATGRFELKDRTHTINIRYIFLF